jgi:hypothetical protein
MGSKKFKLKEKNPPQVEKFLNRQTCACHMEHERVRAFRIDYPEALFK